MTNDLNNLRASIIRRAIKKHHGFSYLEQRYACTHIAFMDKLDQIYAQSPNKKWEAINALAKNDATYFALLGALADSQKTASSTDNPKSDTQKTTTPEIRLIQLQAEEVAASEHNLALKSRYQNLLTQQQNLSCRLQNLTIQLNQKRREAEDLATELNQLTAQQQDLSAELSATSTALQNSVTHLENIHAELNRLQVVTLALYSDGSIDIIEGPNLTLDDSGHEAIYAQISDLDCVQDISLRQIKGLAKLLATAQHLTLRVAFAFDSAATESACTTIIQETDILAQTTINT